jgi:hypothetical protein
MAQIVSGEGALAALLGRAVTETDVGQVPTKPLDLTCRVPYDVLLDQLYEAIDEIVPYALEELRPVRRLLSAWREPADTAPAPSARTMARRVRGVELAWTMTVIVGPELRRLAALDNPSRYLAPFNVILRSYLWGARRAYSSAIVAALDDDPVNVIEYWQNEGVRLVSQFRHETQRLYLHDPKGLEAEIKILGTTIVDLVALRVERGSDALQPRDADALLGVSMTTPLGPWFFEQGLLNELNAIRAASFAVDVTEDYVRFSEKLQGLAAAAQILATRERLSWVADQPWWAGDAVIRLRGYVTELGASALNQAEQAVTRRKAGDHVEAASWQRMAAASASAITTRADFTQDLDSIADTLWAQEVFKAVATGVAIAAVSALSAGAAGAAAGAALATVVDTGTVAGALVVAGGVLVTRLVWETMVARAGSEILIGPDSIKGSTFAEDLGWQVVQTAAAKIVLHGCGDIFKAIEKAGERGKAAAKAAEVAVEQITVFGFGEVQHIVKTGDTRSLQDSVVAAVTQVASVGVVAAGTMMGRTFIERMGTARGGLSADGEAALVRVEQDRADLMQEFDPVRRGTATDAEFLAWAKRAADVWNRYVDIVHGMDDGAEKQAALDQLTLAKGAIELRLAELGITATLTVPGGRPMFEGLLPGMVAYSQDGKPVLDDAVPTNQRRPTDVVDGVLALGPGGRRRLFLPAESIPDEPPKPARLAHVPEANLVPTEAPDVPAAMDPVAAIGLERLRAVKPANWREILAVIPEGEVESFLSLLAHPELENPGTLNTYVQRLAALGGDAESLLFARTWGPVLALRVQLRSGTSGKDLRLDLQRADALLDAEPEATRQALIDKMMAAGGRVAFRRIIGTGKPARPRSKPQRAENLGVDKTSPEWILLRAEVEAAFPLRTTAQKDATASVRQAYSKGNTPFMRGLPPEQRRQMVLQFDALLVTAGIRPAPGVPGNHLPANNLRGKYCEFLFTPDGMDRQTRWYKRQPYAGNQDDRSDLDGHREEGGVHIFLELKSDRIDDQTPGKLNSTARDYLDEGTEDVNDNLPLGSKYYLWFIHLPSGDQAGIDAMRAILVKPGGPITDAFFGPQTPAPLVFK